jgi:hypothetical protein
MVETQASKPEAKDAEGANLDLAKPDETLRQKDPALNQLWKIPHGIPTV